ncbi:MAG: DUF5009 domain-containing protein, partial [Lentisphaerota bacterium]
MTENQNKTVSEEPGQRLVSVDALRGFDMLWITGAGSLLVVLDRMFKTPLTSFLAKQMEHVEWE